MDAFSYVFFYQLLILVFIKKEVVFTWIIRPDILDAFIHFSFIFNFLKIFDNFKRSA